LRLVCFLTRLRISLRDFVQVSGQVKEFDVAGFERDLGVDLNLEFDRFLDDDLGDRRGDPAVQADLVTFSPRTTPVAEASTAEDIAERPRLQQEDRRGGRTGDRRPAFGGAAHRR